MKFKSFFMIAVLLASALTVSTKATASEVDNSEKSAVCDVGKHVNTVFVITASENVTHNIAFEQLIVYPSPAIVKPVYRYEKRKFMSFNKDRNRYNYQRYGMANKQKVKNKAITSNLKVNARNQLLQPILKQLGNSEETDI